MHITISLSKGERMNSDLHDLHLVQSENGVEPRRSQLSTVVVLYSTTFPMPPQICYTLCQPILCNKDPSWSTALRPVWGVDVSLPTIFHNDIEGYCRGKVLSGTFQMLSLIHTVRKLGDCRLADCCPKFLPLVRSFQQLFSNFRPTNVGWRASKFLSNDSSASDFWMVSTQICHSKYKRMLGINAH